MASPEIRNLRQRFEQFDPYLKIEFCMEEAAVAGPPGPVWNRLDLSPDAVRLKGETLKIFQEEEHRISLSVNDDAWEHRVPSHSSITLHFAEQAAQTRHAGLQKPQNQRSAHLWTPARRGDRRNLQQQRRVRYCRAALPHPSGHRQQVHDWHVVALDVMRRMHALTTSFRHPQCWMHSRSLCHRPVRRVQGRRRSGVTMSNCLTGVIRDKEPIVESEKLPPPGHHVLVHGPGRQQ